jgi:hypothetical protein
MGIFARIANDKGQVLSISAREGRFLANRENRNTIIFRLTDGTIVQDMPGQSPRVLSFPNMTCRSTCRRSSASAPAATRAANISCPSCSSSAGTRMSPLRNRPAARRLSAIAWSKW